MVTCPSCGHESPADFAFCPACGSSLTVTAREVRKVVTVLFCDLTGSTELGDRTDPESLRALMRRYYETPRAVVERHGATGEKFVGDAVNVAAWLEQALAVAELAVDAAHGAA